MKKLETARLILRKLKQSDLKDFYNYAKKETIGPNAGWPYHRSIGESKFILNQMIKDNDVWGLIHKDNNKLIGTIGLHVRNVTNAVLNQKEIGYALDDIYWNQGLVTEACLEVIKYAFLDEKLDKVLCGHAFENIGSKRVIEKCGFKYTHIERRPNFEQHMIDVYMYEIKREDYMDLKLGAKI